MIGGGQTHSCFVAGCLDLDKRCLTSHVAFDYVSCCFYSKKLSAVCQLFVSCLSVVCQLFVSCLSAVQPSSSCCCAGSFSLVSVGA